MVRLLEYCLNPSPESRFLALAAAEEVLRITLLAHIAQGEGE